MGQTNEGENVPTSFMPMPIQNQTCENERHKEIEREKESCKYMQSDSLFKNLHLILMRQ